MTTGLLIGWVVLLTVSYYGGVAALKKTKLF